MYDTELVEEILTQILTAAERINRRFSTIEKVDVFCSQMTGLINWMPSV